MRRILAAALVLAVGVACRDAALASGKARDADKALCAAAHSIPHILLAYHHQQVDRITAMGRLGAVKETIQDNATGPHGPHLRDLAAAIHVFQIVTIHRGDTGDAYRDLRALRESLPQQPHCPAAAETKTKKPPSP